MALPVIAPLLAESLLAFEMRLLPSSTSRIVAWSIGLAIVLTAAWGASIACDRAKRWKRNRVRRAAKQSQTVFDEICAAQGLSASEKQQLLAGAELLKLQSPSLLFIDSGLLNRLAVSDTDSAEEYRRLANRFFSSEDDTVDANLIDSPEVPAGV